MIKSVKKVLLVSISLIMIFTCDCFADDEIEEVTADDYNNLSIEVSADVTEEPETFSKHIICIERTTGEVLFEKDAYTKTAMASTTKIMTAIIVLGNCDLSESVEISSKAANTGGSTLGITAGTTMTMESLMYGLLLRSRK